MKTLSRKVQIEYGDFQTPIDLADDVCQKLTELNIQPDVIIEPTCGLGAFVEAAAESFPSARKIIGVEINPSHLASLEVKRKLLRGSDRIEIRQGDFFKLQWSELLRELEGTVLVLGNFPWVTNAQQGVIGGSNLPEKLNLHNHSGIDAITGRSNFDISEWMLIQVAEWFQHRKGYLAMLCKTSVARKFLKHLYTKRIGLREAAMYRIDARKHFDAAVEACLLVCTFDPSAHNYDYTMFSDLTSETWQRVGHRDGAVVHDLDAFERLSYLHGENSLSWRSGIKHDCAEVMELHAYMGQYLNGLGEAVNIEPTFVFPLLKGSDVANNRVTATNRYMLVTQTYVGEPTHKIKELAPDTWTYLEVHADMLNRRKSTIYQNNPIFSIFGVGTYTFAPWKIAICSLYKTLSFRLIGPIDDKPVVFDDTVYFLGFASQLEARRILDFLTSSPAIDFLSSLIFWDEKRPIKTSVLNSLRLLPLEEPQNLRLF